MSTEQDVSDQLLALRGLTATTGILHDLQTQQLKLWPFVAVNDCVSSTATFNFDAKTVIFNIKAKKKSFKDRAKKLGYLCDWTQELLGEYVVEVWINDSLIYTKEPNVARNSTIK